MKAFDFGLNWRAFSQKLVDESRLRQAMASLQVLLQRPHLVDLSFLDIGCGSGLFSIAAARLGAKPVWGVDVNPTCIAVARENAEKFSAGEQIHFSQGSILEPESLTAFGQFDIVYAWGVLHHTGAMWDAVRNSCRMVKPDGHLVLAIYNRHITSPIWRGIKWLYNHCPPIGQRLMVILLAGVIYVAKFLVTHRNPLHKERGMDFWYDVVDWVGGYPYEYATPQEVDAFVLPLGFELVKFVPAEVPTGCNEFVFRRVA